VVGVAALDELDPEAALEPELALELALDEAELALEVPDLELLQADTTTKPAVSTDATFTAGRSLVIGPPSWAALETARLGAGR